MKNLLDSTVELLLGWKKVEIMQEHFILEVTGNGNKQKKIIFLSKYS